MYPKGGFLWKKEKRKRFVVKPTKFVECNYSSSMANYISQCLRFFWQKPQFLCSVLQDILMWWIAHHWVLIGNHSFSHSIYGTMTCTFVIHCPCQAYILDMYAQTGIHVHVNMKKLMKLFLNVLNSTSTSLGSDRKS